MSIPPTEDRADLKKRKKKIKKTNCVSGNASHFRLQVCACVFPHEFNEYVQQTVHFSFSSLDQSKAETKK